jgi:transcriptional regulator with XRE-family HTH domain
LDPAPARDTGRDSEHDDPSFGQHLRQIRKRRIGSQQVLAKRIKEVAENYHGAATVSALGKMISSWERGLYKPSQYNRFLLALALGTTVEDLGLFRDPDFVPKPSVPVGG